MKMLMLPAVFCLAFFASGCASETDDNAAEPAKASAPRPAPNDPYEVICEDEPGGECPDADDQSGGVARPQTDPIEIVDENEAPGEESETPLGEEESLDDGNETPE